MEFNKILPENFFNLFQSKHRDLYIESLVRIYEKYETGSILGMNKEDARDIVEYLLEEKKVGLNEFLDDDPDEEIPSYRELANYFLRRFEATGWITIDVTNDYLEILNFTDYSVSLVLAFIEIRKSANYSLFADNFTLDPSEQAFRGYIFTIYSLLNSKTFDYGLLLNQVYKNTINFVREIRKVDQKLKEFIGLIDQKEKIKDLIELLSEYKDEVMDKAYLKLKTFDNINKYKLDIIKKLEYMQEDSDIMSIITNDYLFLAQNDVGMASFIANKQINDCIDIYNSLEGIMDEIDKKNRDYISQTLSKVKYLLNDSTDIASELNAIITFYSKKVKKGREESAFNDIKNLFTFTVDKSLSPSSLSVPRGTYERTENNKLVKEIIDFSQFKDDFLKLFKSTFSEEDIEKLLSEKIKPGSSISSGDLIDYEAQRDDILRIIYVAIYASGIDEFEIIPQETYTECRDFIVKDFKIERRIR
ncbi:MAG: hypothetical protein H6687_01955 [Bacillales bacterium]|nr:hypothetical protein [Bacillales bacterium]